MIAILKSRGPASLAPLLRRLTLAPLLLLGACAGFDGRSLVPGAASLADIERDMGMPALRWQNPDGSQQLAYPRGPSGYETFMVRVGPDGRLLAIDNVLAPDALAAVRPGMTRDDVLRTLGPPDPAGTKYFAARDELVWDWRYCSDHAEPTRFYVLFDAGSGRVRNTMSQTESLLGFDFDGRRFCGNWVPPRHPR